MAGKAHTKEDKKRFSYLQDIGCLPCCMKGLGHNPVDIHHILSGGRRQSHQHTIGLCPYHHRGVLPSGLSDKKAEEIMGPSLANNKKAFYNDFGSENELLAATNEAIEVVKQSYI